MAERLDDIIFENRNREYGAYILRKGYNRLVIISFLISAVFISLIILGAFFYYYLESAPSFDAGELMATYEMFSGTDYELSVPPGAEPQSAVDQTIIPKVEVKDKPVVVRKEVETPDELTKKQQQIRDSLAKLGDRLAVKGGTGSGSDTGAIYVRVERYPEFPGGNTTALLKYLRDNIKYPASAIQKKISGTVHVNFVITASGRVDKVKITKSVDPELDYEAIRIVKAMPLWSPGIWHARPVNVLVTLPIRFVPGG
ncbi:MAG: TonB family protein [Bacteroidetes bacterium]|nr:TonB family protein [Bacteroidota bacterium]